MLHCNESTLFNINFPMHIAVYSRAINASMVPFVHDLFQNLLGRNASLKVHNILLNALYSSQTLQPEGITGFSTHEELKGQVDVLFSIGGDGTLLDTISMVKDSGIPVIGINTGRLGFLASIAKEDIEIAIDNLFQGNYTLDKRSLLCLESSVLGFGDVNYALNEFTLHKKDSSSMVTIHAFLNGFYLNSYWADGLIVSTPTGSTGYSLSCGGPLIVPQSENFVITPIAPHNLNVRPIVVPDNSVITLEMESRGQQLRATLDSRSVNVDASLKLTIKKHHFDISLLRLNNEQFLSTLRNKLMWGIDKRN
jgi:NAD+ kinase